MTPLSNRQREWVALSSGDLSAAVDPLGAQLSTLCDRAGRSLLWDGDPAVWTGRAPLLFPIVGELASGSYRLGSTRYDLSRHGFARGKLFHIVAADSAGASFRLTADEATLKIYPYRFELEVRFRVEGPTLSVTAGIRNAGDDSMPASFGYHPAFRWPLPFGRARSSHFIEFSSEESATIRRLNTAGLLTTERHPSPISHGRLTLADALFRDDAIIFDDIHSRSVTYGAVDGPRLRVSFPDTPYLGVWSKPQAHFICIEPWHGIADPDGFSGDFRTKPGVFMVAPGATRSITMAITLLEL